MDPTRGELPNFMCHQPLPLLPPLGLPPIPPQPSLTGIRKPAVKHYINNESEEIRVRDINSINKKEVKFPMDSARGELPNFMCQQPIPLLPPLGLPPIPPPQNIMDIRKPTIKHFINDESEEIRVPDINSIDKKDVKRDPETFTGAPSTSLFDECWEFPGPKANIKIEEETTQQKSSEDEGSDPNDILLVEMFSPEAHSDTNRTTNRVPEKPAKPTAGCKLSCEYCGKNFTQIGGLSIHLRTHTGEKPYSCGDCGRQFAQKSNLNKHMVTHTGEKPHSCDECGKSFSQTSNLHKHVKIHVGEKSYCCDQCGKAFIQSSNLNKHKKIHLNERPYTCSECGKAFTQTSNLNKHKKVHAGERPYSCHECGKSFTQSSNLNKHMKVHLEEFACPFVDTILSTPGNLNSNNIGVNICN